MIIFVFSEKQADKCRIWKTEKTGKESPSETQESEEKDKQEINTD